MTASAKFLAFGSLVIVGPAFSQASGKRDRVDGYEGPYTVVGHSGLDVLLVRGHVDARDLTIEDYQVAINVGRISPA